MSGVEIQLTGRLFPGASQATDGDVFTCLPFLFDDRIQAYQLPTRAGTTDLGGSAAEIALFTGEERRQGHDMPPY